MLSPTEIRALRERLDLSQKDFGVLLGYMRYNKPGARVRSWEEEREYPCWQAVRHLRTLTAVANALLALDLNRFDAARECLEQVFKPEGASPKGETQIQKMERAANGYG